jgi:tetratricopeptide (TPR) repeat protein
MSKHSFVQRYGLTLGSVLISAAIVWKSNLFQHKSIAPAATFVSNTAAPENFYAAGVQLVGAGKFGEALAKFNQAHQQNPADPYAHFGRGWAVQMQGDQKSAITHYAQALQQAQAIEASAHFNMALAHAKLGDFQSAKTHFLLASEKNPNQAQTQYWLGFVHQSLGQKTEAQDFYQKALAIDPSLSDARARLDALKSQ